MSASRPLLLRACLLALLLLAAAEPARAQGREESEPSPIEAIRAARRNFDYGNFAVATRALQKVDISALESAELRVEAYKLLGLSWFFQGKEGESYRAFLELLNLDPDFELDTFLYPPAAVAFFERVKREAEPQLAPVRALRRAEEEARLKALREEAARRRAREQEDDQRRLVQLAPVVERRVVQREFWVTLLPFGVGQIQNGDRSLGIALATSQVLAGATSAGSALLIEGLRDSSTGKFGPGVYPLASRLNLTKWAGAAIFYGLWAAGAVHAVLNFSPETALPDRLVTQGQLQTPPAPVQPPPGPLPAPQLPPQLLPAPAPSPSPSPSPSPPPSPPPSPSPSPSLAPPPSPWPTPPPHSSPSPPR